MFAIYRLFQCPPLILSNDYFSKFFFLCLVLLLIKISFAESLSQTHLILVCVLASYFFCFFFIWLDLLPLSFVLVLFLAASTYFFFKQNTMLEFVLIRNIGGRDRGGGLNARPNNQLSFSAFFLENLKQYSWTPLKQS